MVILRILEHGHNVPGAKVLLQKHETGGVDGGNAQPVGCHENMQHVVAMKEQAAMIQTLEDRPQLDGRQVLQVEVRQGGPNGRVTQQPPEEEGVGGQDRLVGRQDGVVRGDEADVGLAAGSIAVREKRIEKHGDPQQELWLSVL